MPPDRAPLSLEAISEGQIRASLDGIEREQWQYQDHQRQYLQNMSDWSPAVCAALALEDDLQLSYNHWLVNAYLRMYYDHYQIAPAVRVLVKAIGRQLGRKWGNSKYLYELYAYGPAKQACLYGGIPVAHGGCI